MHATGNAQGKSVEFMPDRKNLFVKDGPIHKVLTGVVGRVVEEKTRLQRLCYNRFNFFIDKNTNCAFQACRSSKKSCEPAGLPVLLGG